MRSNSLYELLVEDKHIGIIIDALSNYICSQYDGIDAELVDIPKTIENIKIASDMQLVLKHHLGWTNRNPTQTAETTGLIWIKEVNLDEQASSYDEDLFDIFNEDRLQQAWNSVKECHKDTLQRMSDK